MIVSVDGKASMGNKASGIGSEVDRKTMRNIRAQVDAVMVGAGTLRAEKLSLGLGRESEGPQPLAIILTASGSLPLHDNLVQHEGQDVLVITTKAKEDSLAGSLKGIAEVLGVPATPGGYPDLTCVLRTLKQEHSVRSLLVEGGPRLNQTLISRGLLDELFLTVAPKLLGGTHNDPRTIIEGGLPTTNALHLISIHLVADELFLRYSLAGPPD